MLHQVGVSFDLYISAQRKASHWIRTVYIRQTFRIKIPVTFIFALIALIEFFEHLIYKHGPSHHKVVPTAINLANRGTDRQTQQHQQQQPTHETYQPCDIKFHYFKLCETENLILEPDQRERNNLQQNNWKRLSERWWRVTDGRTLSLSPPVRPSSKFSLFRSLERNNRIKKFCSDCSSKGTRSTF